MVQEVGSSNLLSRPSPPPACARRATRPRIPDSVTKLCDQITWADAIVISTPEYNKAPSGVLKNMLDWVSRPRPAPMAGKPVAIMAATAGAAGGQRAQSALFLMLIPFKVRLILNPEVNVGSNYEAFEDNGQLKPGRAADSLEALMGALKAEI